MKTKVNVHMSVQDYRAFRAGFEILVSLRSSANIANPILVMTTMSHVEFLRNQSSELVWIRKLRTFDRLAYFIRRKKYARKNRRTDSGSNK